MTHTGLPVHGYKPQSASAVEVVNVNKRREEKLLRGLDLMAEHPAVYDPRWLSIARTHFEQGFMALNRSIMQPTRVKLEGDPE